MTQKVVVNCRVFVVMVVLVSSSKCNGKMHKILFYCRHDMCGSDGFLVTTTVSVATTATLFTSSYLNKYLGKARLVGKGIAKQYTSCDGREQADERSDSRIQNRVYRKV